jgi:hypothetical protein
MRLKDFTNLPSHVRRNISLSVHKRKYVREKRKDYSSDELEDYLRRNNIHTIGQLDAFRKEGDPKVQDFRKAFDGKWSNAVRATFGRPINAEPNLYYLLKCVWQRGLTTREKYLAARRKEPEVFPSMRGIKKEFKTFRDFQKCARAYDILRTTLECLKLRRRLGRNPTMPEYKQAGLIMEYAIESYDGIGKWNEYLENMARLSAQGKGNQQP